MWDKDLDVYIDGVIVDKREQIENAQNTVSFYLIEYQYSAQLDFDKPQQGNIEIGRASCRERV